MQIGPSTPLPRREANRGRHGDVLLATALEIEPTNATRTLCPRTAPGSLGAFRTSTGRRPSSPTRMRPCGADGSSLLASGPKRLPHTEGTPSADAGRGGAPRRTERVPRDRWSVATTVPREPRTLLCSSFAGPPSTLQCAISSKRQRPPANLTGRPSTVSCPPSKVADHSMFEERRA
jgi:hypothetical protein